MDGYSRKIGMNEGPSMNLEEIEEWSCEMDAGERVGHWLQDDSFTNVLANQGLLNITKIDYQSVKRTFTIKELCSLALFDLCAEHSIRCDVHKAYLKVMNSTEGSESKAWDPRTTQKIVDKITGIQPVIYDCCINSCMCFTGKYIALQVCMICNKP